MLVKFNDDIINIIVNIIKIAMILFICSVFKKIVFDNKKTIILKLIKVVSVEKRNKFSLAK